MGKSIHWNSSNDVFRFQLWYFSFDFKWLRYQFPDIWNKDFPILKKIVVLPFFSSVLLFKKSEGISTNWKISSVKPVDTPFFTLKISVGRNWRFFWWLLTDLSFIVKALSCTAKGQALIAFVSLTIWELFAVIRFVHKNLVKGPCSQR